MSKVVKALSSLRLAIALIAYLTIVSILASLLPQGRDAGFYRALLPGFLAEAAVSTGFSNFFGSLLFIVPALLLFANLSTCTVERFARELRKKGARSHGPDILHLGLILLIVGAVLGQVARQSHPSWQGFARLAAGDAVQLPDGRLLTLKDLKSERYPDGRPKDWVSTVVVSGAGRAPASTTEIRVNHPLRLGALSIYQASFGSERSLVLEDAGGARRSMVAGESLETGEGRLMLMSVDLDSGVAVARKDAPAGTSSISLRAGSRIGAFTVLGAREEAITGLQAAYDPFFPLILVAFIVTALGAFVTFGRRLGELRR
jgi:cytochrome c biogenesis protein ResB